MRLKVSGEVTGYVGSVLFENGVSVGTVSPKTVNLFKAIMSGVEVMEDDGITVDAALNSMTEILPIDYYLQNNLTPPSKYLTNWLGAYPQRPEQVEQVKGETEQAPAETKGPLWTRQALEQIVDKEGIKGLRAIAPEGVTGRSVNDLIEAMLAYRD